MLNGFNDNTPGGRVIQDQTIYTPIQIPDTGWSCPKCGRCYSPRTAQCFYCGPNFPAPSIPTIPYPNPIEPFPDYRPWTWCDNPGWTEDLLPPLLNNRSR